MKILIQRISELITLKDENGNRLKPEKILLITFNDFMKSCTQKPQTKTNRQKSKTD